MPVPKYQYFSPADAGAVSKLHLTARQVVEGLITGLHKSPHRGFSVEFSEHRDYVPGDELRHLDWRAYARTDRYYIKLFEQETNLRATLVLDNSASMAFGKKLDYSRHLAACLAYLLSIQQDMVGLVAIDESIKLELPSGSTPAHLDRMFRALEALSAGTATNLPAQMNDLIERLPRRSLVILISDLWVDAAEFSRALQHLAYRKHQGVVLHLIDRAELELPYSAMVTLQDMETGEKLQIDANEIRPTYRQQVEEHVAALRGACNNCDVEYHAMDVAERYDRAMTRLMTRRAK